MGGFRAAYVGAVVFVASGLACRPGDVLLVLAAGSRLSAYIGATVGEIGFLRGIWMDGSVRLAWLEDYAASLVASADRPVPARLPRASASSTSPSPTRDRLASFWRTSTSTSRPGAVVAIVGENGAGKRTLVKLLAKLYEPTSGRILVDDVELARMAPDGWRSRLAGAFQDFFRFELKARQTVGVGDVAGWTMSLRSWLPSIAPARRMSSIGCQRGSIHSSGRPGRAASRCRFGQWQKLALARGFMRDEPLLLVLDEPTAALDAETEHELFEHYASAARRRDGARTGSTADDGRITVLVSHRFSTVRMADLIVVLNGARVVETGTHDDLMAQGGQYAELYNIQAAAYR